MQIRKRKWGWLGHTLRKSSDDIARQAVEWNPQGKRGRGRPKNTWRRTVLEEASGVNKTWAEIKADAKNRVRWKILVEALWSAAEWRDAIKINCCSCSVVAICDPCYVISQATFVLLEVCAHCPLWLCSAVPWCHALQVCGQDIFWIILRWLQVPPYQWYGFRLYIPISCISIVSHFENLSGHPFNHVAVSWNNIY